MQGLGPHWEIWGFVQGGMSPLEALRVATLSPAKTLGLDNDLGSIEPGKLADFVILEKDPHEVDPDTIVDIRIVRTVLGGRTVFAA